DYSSLYKWSIDNIPDFWASFWDYADIIASKKYDVVVDDLSKLPGAKWFEGAELNFAENLLRYRDDRVALIFKGENQDSTKMTHAEIYNEVAKVAKSLKEAGIEPGDRVVGFIPNMPEAIIAMLAATSLGAVWSSCSPDFGIKGVLDRFGQIEPKILFTANGYSFKGKNFNSLERVSEILKDLPTIEKVIVVPYTEERADISNVPNALHYSDFKSFEDELDVEFKQLPFSHPLYIMFTSGTTGLPKCMVQSAGGILIHQLKELMLHTDLKRDDVIFYFTTCGWMMWNWLVCSLGVGASIVLFDGNPFYPDPGALWQMVEDEKITVFGTSAGYIAALMNAGVQPKENYDLTHLKSILSTGSPLSVESFDYIYREVKEDIQLASISGGSDINGCFAAGNPMGPVYAGELQCRCLAMDVHAYDADGNSIIDREGELVCIKPSPSMPIYFWDDPGGEKYHKAYFDVYPNVWRHGDFVVVTKNGGVVMYGRSDATLNPGGVRIGTSEIYRIVENMEEIDDSLVVGQDWKGDVRVVLFVKMADGYELTDELKDKIRKGLRAGASPRHVPAKIIAAPDVLYTLNMKKVELAVKKAIEGKEILNRDALRNPEVLDFYADVDELKVD
ncbi:acetoacetate--CoA ligase, partial [bacterium]|nr:acetoacetate--CoA ligase [bacterium]MBU1024512.1 acetoacetate--CoA ligase [bacterium]